MKKNIIISILILVALSAIYLIYVHGGTPIKLEIKVVDDVGNPVENVLVTGYFDDPRSRDTAGRKFKLRTNKDGICKVIGVAHLYVGIRLYKTGFYDSKYRVIKLRHGDEILRSITVVIKKIKNPIPMIVKKVKITIPEQGKNYAFDFEVGDLVQPYGKGQARHIYVFYKLTGNSREGKDIFKFITGSQCSGLIKSNLEEYSLLESQYLAPDSGYTNKMEFVLHDSENKRLKNTRLKKNEYLFFRVQNNTNSRSFNYGKIYFPLSYGVENEKNVAEFTYYYNPTTNDRNLEFDPKQNLIKTVDRRGKDNSDRFKP